MSANEQARWDAVYRKFQGQPLPAPDPLLLQFTPPPPETDAETRALDLAAGQGQNALWLAGQGYVVDVMDVSRVGLERGRAEAERRGLRSLNFFQIDLDHATLEANLYRLVCVFRYLKRDLFSQIRASVAPGGRVIYQTFNTEYLRTRYDANPDHLLHPGELGGYFADWKILYQSDDEHISQLVALKPEF